MGWNDRQLMAICETGKDILVSASAGSGKTAVLSERIVKLCLEDKIDIDKFVVVTFTRLAAFEMKSRIEKKLNEKRDTYEDIDFLERQLILLNKANISTLDSFNIALLRDYFYMVDLEPNFKIIDDIDAKILEEDILNKVFEKYYKEKDEEFLELITMYSDQRTDNGLKKLVLDLYNHASNMKDIDNALSSLLSNISFDNFEQGIYYSYLKNYIKENLKDFIEFTDEYKDLYSIVKLDNEFLHLLNDTIDLSYDEFYKVIKPYEYARITNSKEYKELNDDIKNIIKKVRDDYKKFTNELKEKFYKDTLDNFKKEMTFMMPYLNKLIEITKVYKEELDKSKKQNNNYDFNDLAHFVIKLLIDEKGNKTKIAKTLSDTFSYIIIDEYQDVNEIQETILNAIKKDNEESNMFMVGDVKQSIYRFRKADPEIFTTKYNNYKEEKDSYSMKIDLNQNYRSRKGVLDSINFIFEKVMTKEIGKIEYDDEMALKYGELYDDKLGYDYKTELLLIPKDLLDIKMQNNNNDSNDSNEINNEVKKETKEKNNSDEEDDELNLSEGILEAKVITKKIKELMDSNYQVKDGDNYRPIEYSDIAILYRSLKDSPMILFNELKKNGIPTIIAKQDNFLEQIDVIIAISMMKVIDNPYDDIAFVETLYSDYYKFTPVELMDLKKRNRYKTSFFDICNHEYKLIHDLDNKDIKEEKNNEVEKDEIKIELSDVTKNKITKVIDTYNYLKTYSIKNTISDLVKKIYKIFNQEKYLMRFMDMKNKVDNLNLLLRYANNFDKSNSKNLYDFISNIKRIEDIDKSVDIKSPLESSNAVSIMTIHKSKGLEYPIVFIPSLNRKINMMDTAKKTLIDKNLGYMTEYINTKKAYRKSNVLFETMKKKITLDNIAEELRIYYVAMTRAKEKLYLVSTINDKKIDKYEDQIKNNKMKFNKISSVTRPLDFIYPCVRTICSEKYINEIFIKEEDIDFSKEELNDELSPMKKLFDEVLEEEKNNINKKINKDDNYKYINSINIKQKVSVTELKKKYMESSDNEKEVIDDTNVLDTIIFDKDEELENELEKINSNDSLIYKPKSDIYKKITRKDKDKLTPNEKGTLMHKLVKIINDKDVDKEFERLIKSNIFKKEELDQIDKDKINMYLSHDIVDRINKSNFVKREMPFMMKVKANEIYKDLDISDDDEVIVQGIIDLLFEEDDKLVILDYKTDKVFKDGITKEERIEELKKNYKVQLDLYEKAAGLIYNKEIKEKVLYLFDSGDLIDIDK